MTEGLVFLLNQAGLALADAEKQIAQLVDENQRLRKLVDDSDGS